MKQHVFDFQRYQGRLTPTPQRDRIDAKFCAHLEHRDTFGVETRCQASMINGDQWCYQHKDPDGYVDRLERAYQEAQQRCLEAYPFCRRCGRRLSADQVRQGLSRCETFTSDQYRHECIP